VVKDAYHGPNITNRLLTVAGLIHAGKSVRAAGSEGDLSWGGSTKTGSGRQESLSQQRWRQLQQGGPILHASKLSMTFVQFLQLCQDRGLVGPDGLNPADLEQVGGREGGRATGAVKDCTAALKWSKG
jgi:hypothetical protein